MDFVAYFPQQRPSSISIILVLVVAFCLSRAIYRVWFDPLSKFPGPKLAAITRYYECYYDVYKNGQYTFKIGELHKAYGPIIRISPYELHINDPEFYEKLYQRDGRWVKYGFTYDAFGIPGSGLAALDHDLHRMRRSASSPFFSKQNIVRLLPLIQGHVEKLRQRILGFVETGNILSLEFAYPALTMDIITEYAMGKSTGNLDHEDFNYQLAGCTKGFGKVAHLSKHVSGAMWVFQHTPTSVVRRLDPMAGQWKNFIERCFAQIRDVRATYHDEDADSKTHRTVFHELMNHPSLPAVERTDARLVDEAVSFVSAGTETTGHTLRMLTYYLCQDTAILQRLRKELRAANLSDPPRIEQLERLPYLNAVLSECLRFSYDVCSRLARIAPDRIIKYRDWEIPAGTPVGMTSVLIVHNEDIFPDHGKFDPDRWVDPAERRRLEKYFSPFSRGTRNCLGLNLAWVELYLITAMVVLNFDFTLYETTAADVDLAYDHFIPGVKGKNGVRVTVKRAESA